MSGRVRCLKGLFGLCSRLCQCLRPSSHSLKGGSFRLGGRAWHVSVSHLLSSSHATSACGDCSMTGHLAYMVHHTWQPRARDVHALCVHAPPPQVLEAMVGAGSAPCGLCGVALVRGRLPGAPLAQLSMWFGGGGW